MIGFGIFGILLLLGCYGLLFVGEFRNQSGHEGP